MSNLDPETNLGRMERLPDQKNEVSNKILKVLEFEEIFTTQLRSYMMFSCSNCNLDIVLAYRFVQTDVLLRQKFCLSV